MDVNWYVQTARQAVWFLYLLKRVFNLNTETRQSWSLAWNMFLLKRWQKEAGTPNMMGLFSMLNRRGISEKPIPSVDQDIICETWVSYKSLIQKWQTLEHLLPGCQGLLPASPCVQSTIGITWQRHDKARQKTQVPESKWFSVHSFCIKLFGVIFSFFSFSFQWPAKCTYTAWQLLQPPHLSTPTLSQCPHPTSDAPLWPAVLALGLPQHDEMYDPSQASKVGAPATIKMLSKFKFGLFCDSCPD